MSEKRIQELERSLEDLSSIVDQLKMANARPGPGSNIRIAKVITSGTHPTTGQTFEIEFEKGTYTEAGGNTPTYSQRVTATDWCCNVIDHIPALNDYILVWYLNDRWWTKCEDPSP